MEIEVWERIFFFLSRSEKGGLEEGEREYLEGKALFGSFCRMDLALESIDTFGKKWIWFLKNRKLFNFPPLTLKIK
jgi:hypothetical protein